MADFDISDVETWGSITRELVIFVSKLYVFLLPPPEAYEHL